MRDSNTAYDNQDLDAVYALMMDALDGELSVDQERELTTHLQANPDLQAEWHAMEAVDTLFRETPSILPPKHFTQRTLDRLPNVAYRRMITTVLFGGLMLAGVLPLFIAALLYGNFGAGILSASNMLGYTRFFQQLWEVSGIMINVFTQLVEGMGTYLSQQPYVLGYLMIMIGFISLWSGVYKQMIRAPRMATTR